MSTTKSKVIRGDDLKIFAQSYKRPVGADGKLLKVREYSKEQLSDFRRWTNYNYRLKPQKQELANQSALRCHHNRKKIEEDYQRNAYLHRIGGTYRRPHVTKDFLTFNALD